MLFLPLTTNLQPRLPLNGRMLVYFLRLMYSSSIGIETTAVEGDL
jgi:hypothetical protein